MYSAHHRRIEFARTTAIGTPVLYCSRVEKADTSLKPLVGVKDISCIMNCSAGYSPGVGRGGVVRYCRLYSIGVSPYRALQRIKPRHLDIL